MSKKQLATISLYIAIFSQTLFAETGACGSCLGCSTFWEEYKIAITTIEKKEITSEKKIAKMASSMKAVFFPEHLLNIEIARQHAKITILKRAILNEQMRYNKFIKKRKGENKK